jgi:hypothetical protein
MGMSKDVSFVLDPKGGEQIIQGMMMQTVKEHATAIAARAQSIAGSMSSNPPTITTSTRLGTIKRGVRAIATVSAEGDDAHENYIGHVALAKAKDAGRN